LTFCCSASVDKGEIQLAFRLVITCIGYLVHPFKVWIAYRCKCARSDPFTPEELPLKKDAIQTEEEARQ
jgi:hypothetical protein